MPLEPSRFSIGIAQGSALPPLASMSAPVITASTPGAALRGADVDRGDAGVRLGRAHDAAVDLAGEIDVVGVAPRPGDEPLILDPPHRLTDAELRHDATPPRRCSETRPTT